MTVTSTLLAYATLLAVPDSEVATTPGWADTVFKLLVFVLGVGSAYKAWQSDRSRKQEAARRRKVGRRVTKTDKRIDSLDAQLTAIESARERLIELLQSENQQLRDQYKETVERHTKESIELRELLASARTELTRSSEDFKRLQDAYDRSRVEIHGLRGELQKYAAENQLLQAAKAENERLKSENARLVIELANLVKCPPPPNGSN